MNRASEATGNSGGQKAMTKFIIVRSNIGVSSGIKIWLP